MKLSTRTIKYLAQAICGSHGFTGGSYHWNNFIYRSSSKLTEFFYDDCELPYQHDGSTRDSWVSDVLTELNEGRANNSKLPADNIVRVIIELLKGIKTYYPEKHENAVDDVNNILSYSELGIRLEGEKYVFTSKPMFAIEQYDQQTSSISSDLFITQFPAGLPFGVDKPDFAIIADKGIQKLSFVVKKGMGLLKKDVYPNFNFRKLEASFGVDESTNQEVIKKALVNMNQTPSEKEFFRSYANTFKMANPDIPTLIPQAWVQWHSQPKKNLRLVDSKHTDELYRIDFVAFWNHKRYAILVDDISHYGKRGNSNLWLADEEGYSKRLKEDRKLRKEGWEVFRISNSEIRNNSLMPEILNDLKDFIGF